MNPLLRGCIIGCGISTLAVLVVLVFLVTDTVTVVLAAFAVACFVVAAWLATPGSGC